MDRPKGLRFLSADHGSQVRARRAALVVLGAQMMAFIGLYGFLTLRQHAGYGTEGFDLGIFDQATWLLSQGETGIISMRGLPVFGHHANLVLVLLAPLYLLDGGPEMLLVVQTLALAAGAIPVFLLARQRLESLTGALVVSGAYLLHPALAWMTWWQFHPEVLALSPLLFAWWFAERRRWWPFSLCILLALLCKEDVAIAVSVLGLALAVLRRQWRAGLVTLGAGAAWFLVMTMVVIPSELGSDPFYAQSNFSNWGDSIGSVVVGMVTQPVEVARTLMEESRLEYYKKLVGPLGVLPFVGLPFTLVGAPQLVINALSSHPPAHNIRHQYSAMVVVGLFIGSVEALGRLRRRQRWLAVVGVAALAATAIAGHWAWAPAPGTREYASGIWRRPLPRHATFDAAVSRIPAGDGVAASYFIAPHLTHRRHLYQWPAPWVLLHWGLRGENPPSTRSVDWLIIDEHLGEHPELLDELVGQDREFRAVLRHDGLLLARRATPSDTR